MHLIASIRQNIEYVANSVLLNGWLSQRYGKRLKPKCLLFSFYLLGGWSPEGSFIVISYGGYGWHRNCLIV
jgi:hypothetical protein